MTTGVLNEISTVQTEPGRRPAVAFVLWVLKALAMWIVLLASAVLAAKLTAVSMPPTPEDGPLSPFAAFLVVNAMVAATLALIAARARVSGLRLALLLFVVFYASASAMMLIEALYFNDSLRMPMNAIIATGEQELIIALFAAAAGALLFRPRKEDVSAVPSNLTVRVVLLAVIYIVLYFTAGFFIAWQSEAVRTYYSTMEIPLASTVALQFVRGILWALISLYVVTHLKGSLASRAAIMAIAFGVLTAAQLLYPNPFMPGPVRMAHLIEVGSSEFVYGIVATLVLLAGAARHPLADNSAWRLIAGRA